MSLFIIGLSIGLSDGSHRMVQANEILDAFENGSPIEYDDYIVKGDLYLYNLRIDKNIHFNDSIFMGKNQTARGHPTLKGWGMLRAARPG